MNRYLKLFLIFILTNVAVISAIVISHNIEQKKYAAMVDEKDRETYMSIVVPDKMTYSMVKDITGDEDDISYMFKDEESKLNYKFTKDTAENMGRQDLFIYLGMDNEPWAESLLDSVKREKLSIINASRGIISSSLTVPRVIDGKEYKENPYYWMSFENYKIALTNIKSGMIEKDNKNKTTYEENFNSAIEKLESQESEFEEVIGGFSEYIFVTSEDSFDYFLKSRNINNIKIESKNDDESTKDTDFGKYDSIFKPNEKIIFLYGSEDEFNKNNDIINKYSMKPVYIDVDKQYDSYYSFIEGFKNALLSVQD